MHPVRADLTVFRRIKKKKVPLSVELWYVNSLSGTHGRPPDRKTIDVFIQIL